MTPYALVTDHPFATFAPEEAVLAESGLELRLADSTDEARLAALAGGAAAIMACYAPVTAPVVEAAAAGGCRIIARYGIGYDNIDIGAATAHEIVVTNVPDYCLDEVADHTIALLLSLARGIRESVTDVRDGEWRLPSNPIHRLAGRRLALIGYGGIGRRVAHRARAFGFEVVAYDPYASRESEPDMAWADSAQAAVAEADFVSVHAPLTDETRHIVDADLLRAAQRRPIVINTARGGLVDLEAVTEALAADRIAGVALDVTEPEPLPVDHPLRRDNRAVITPHIAYFSHESSEELQRRVAEEVIRVLAGQPPENARNPEVLRSR